ncbi:DEAD/DEAH box helicase [Aquitalea pelogenes]|uniref:DEAD/DEAH box helicase n=1 Tax=Aquitalea pelogenes TaxID=1293573 RepID=UPI0007894296|nr:DEAD/DEAH box helicase [Aquitalea pelogenes]
MTAVYRPYVEPLIQAHRQRGVRSVLSLLGIANDGMRQRLAQMLGGQPGSRNALLADPVFEPTFGWQESAETLADLPAALLHPRLKEALAYPPAQLAEEYAFPASRHPYTHQLEAWQTLATEPARSLVVTSGTGSGKTECFLVPILNRLAHQSAQQGRLQGVRALFIYPLNALIASQQNRLDAWTDKFDGALRYCLYTGNLPNEGKEIEREGFKGRLIDRKELRKSAPPILVTNATMLEYMLIRRDDMPILEQSQGKLEWIVLDEAHTHMGSQAAEMALLLRRTMAAFGVKPENVRFVATSATFGNDSETTEKLRAFLADMAGVSKSQVHVVHGSRHIPALIHQEDAKHTLSDLLAIDADCEVSPARYQALANNSLAVRLRQCFIAGNATQPRKLSELVKETGLSAPQVLAWIDLLSGTSDGVRFFLPLRIHLFHNILSSIGCCANPACSERAEVLQSSGDWRFGELYTDGRTRCDCGAPVLPIVQCLECSELYLQATERKGQLNVPTLPQDDGFTLNLDQHDDDEQAQEGGVGSAILVTNQHCGDETVEAWLSLATHRLTGVPADGTAKLIYHPGSQDCPCCHQSRPGGVIRRMGVGAPFTLSTVISTLLEFCPEDPDLPLTKPFRGRKLISFTDSRQGTARIAVKLQQDAERAYARSYIYHSLLASKPSAALSADEQDELDYLREKQQENQPLRPFQQTRLSELLDKGTQSTAAKLSWSQLKDKLSNATTVQHELLNYYRAISSDIGDGDAACLAEMLLLAEFCRRPKRQNSLETMGLVQVAYPSLATIQTLPQAWPRSANAAQDLQDWKDYLKALLDFHVRENSFVRFSRPEFSRLIGQKVSLKTLLPPTSQEKESNRIKRWPQVRLSDRDENTGKAEARTRQARPIALLTIAFGWTAEANRTAIDSILQTAWEQLCASKILSKEGDGFALDFSQLELQLLSKAALCPLTRRFLDTPFKGITPYQTASRFTAKALQWFDMPVYDLPFGGHFDQGDAIARARSWLDENVGVLQLRELGLWSDLHDRIVEGAQFFRAAEHSAQQSAARLRHYEKLFKAGKLNVMSCSTTMEMGVDIGGINVVAMNNVPPHPANYLQRAGRAGRRREGRSVAMTVCKRTAHDQAVFQDPIWPFKKKVTIPAVAFNSHDLIQRHVNAYLLSRWLKNHLQDGELTRFTCWAFFNRDGQHSVADRFDMWCASADKHLAASADLREVLQSLIKATVLEGSALLQLIEQCRVQLSAISAQWLDTASAIEQHKLQVFGDDKEQTSPAIKAIELQLQRLNEEYLLSELATRKFLPGYGFPTDIVPFDNLTLGQLRKEEEQSRKQQHREDNRGRYRQLASRERGVALREYAPGAEIVMDGLVYRSGGITLNWHMPASEDAMREIQLFKHAWRCTHCGASGDTRVGKPESCDQCGAVLDPQWILPYLVPSGFAVDLFSEPHTDVSKPVYVPIEQPWLSVSGEWQPLLNPALGMLRSSCAAHLFTHNKGQGRHGYAICLECGRSEPMLAAADPDAPADQQFMPKMFRPGEMHKRLRGGRGKDGAKGYCTGSESAWKIKTGIHLGHDTLTDACELVLNHGVTGLPVTDPVIAYTLAVALRTVLARHFGVQEDELGCTVRQVLVQDRLPACAIQIFDQGSAGYTSQADRILRSATIWEEVYQHLQCSVNKCAAACEHCLITFDTQHHVESLDRCKAIEFMDASWRLAMALPDEFKLFGLSSNLACAELAEAVRQYQIKHPRAQLLFWPEGSFTDWDVSIANSLFGQLRHSLSLGYQIGLVLPSSDLATLDEGSRRKLAALSELGLTLVTTPATRVENQLLKLAVLARTDNGEVIGWAVPKTCSLQADETWAFSPDGIQVIEGKLDQWPPLQTVPADALLLASQEDQQLTITTQCNGHLQGFGARLWGYLCEHTPKLAQLLDDGSNALTAIRYSDRYLRSPLVVALLLDFLHALGKMPAGENGLPDIELHTSPISRYLVEAAAKGATSQYRHQDWTSEDVRSRVLAGVFEYAAMRLASNPVMQGCPHPRELWLTFAQGQQVRICFDQGVSYWASASRDTFDFHASIDRQIDAVANMAGSVFGNSAHGTHVFIKFL